MQEGPRVEKCPIAIQFLGTYVIVVGVSNLQGNIEMEIITDVKLAYGTCSSWICKKSHLGVWMLKFWSKLLIEAFNARSASGATKIDSWSSVITII